MTSFPQRCIIKRSMRAKLPLRISSVILFLFALGHTVGFQTFRPASQQGLEVMESMRSVPFAFGKATVHWMDLYVGFGLADRKKHTSELQSLTNLVCRLLL